MSEVVLASVQTKKKIAIGVNFVLGLVLWLGYFTDYSLTGTIPDLLFPPSVGVVGLWSLWLTRTIPQRVTKRMYKLSCLPSFIGGCLPTLLTVFLIIPPCTLGFLISVHELMGETEIQRTVSPDGSRVATVHFRGVGAYSGGNGRIYVRVRYRRFPVIERDVYSLGKSDADEDTDDYIRWVDHDTLFISETQQEVDLGTVRFEIPSFLAIPVLLSRVLWATW